MAVVEILAWIVIAMFAGMLLGAAVAVLWAPFLRAPVVREAMGSGPGPWWANYLLGFSLLGAVHLSALVVLMGAAGSRAVMPDIVVGIPLLMGLLGAFLLVRAMDKVEDVLRTYIVVMGGVLWYMLLTVGPTFFAVAWFLPFR